MIPINYICFLSATGFATAAKNNIQALHEAGYDVNITALDLGSHKKINSDLHDFYKSLIKKSVKNPSIALYHCIPQMQRRVRSVGRTIGYATFETTSPPDNWSIYLNRNDAIITPSMFNYREFKKLKLTTPIFYIPHCINFNVFTPEVLKLVVHKTSFNFLFMGTWKQRKNYEKLITAFLEEFSKQDDVSLTIKTTNTTRVQVENTIKRIKRSIKKIGEFPEIIIDVSTINDDDVASYIKSFDCYISASLGEGFGLPALQAMALKVPTIVPDHSGCVEYGNTDTSLLLVPEGYNKIPCLDNIFQFKNALWPYISVSQIRERMRYAFSHREEMTVKADAAYTYVKQRFSYPVVVKKLAEVLYCTI
jgi:glycosyltransferase involved in cell wall biosynthesis